MSGLRGQPGGSGPVRLERGYRRLLACYPRAYRRENEEEILAVLLACARDGQQRPGLAVSADLIKGAMRLRLWPAARPPRTVRAAVRLLSAVAAAELAYLTVDFVTAGRVRSAVARRYPPGAAATVHHAVSVQLVTVSIAVAISIGVWPLLAWALVRGRNLARFAFAAYFGLDCLKMLQAVGQGAAVTAPADMTAAAVVWLLNLTVCVLLFTGASSRYYPKPRSVSSWQRNFSSSTC